MDLNCRDIESEKDSDTVDYEGIQRDFGNAYHAAAWQAVGLGKRSAYITHLAANDGCSQLVAALSDNSLAVHDWETLKPITSLKGHTAKLTGVRYLPGNESVLISSSLDGTLRQWDSRTGQATMQHTDTTLQSPKPLTCCDVNAPGRFLCAGTELVQEDAFLVFWDVRRPEPLGGYWESHTDEISSVRFHPSDASALATGSTDGYVNVFDVTQRSEEDALQATLNTESSVSSVTWYEREGGRHLAVVLDTEELQCWDLTESEQTAQFQRADVAAALRRTMSEVCYVAGCQSMDDGRLLVLAGSSVKEGSGCLRLLQLQRDKLQPFAQLHDSEVSPQLVRASCCSRQTGCLVTGGEAGILTLWKPGDGPSLPPRSSTKAEPYRTSKKHKHKKAPY